MIVDDSLLSKMYIRRALEEDPKQRFHVIERASNGKQAIYNIKAHMGNIDVITMDIEMPIMNGLEAVKEIMKEHPLPIIMFSSLSKPNANETIKAMEYGAFDCITKPETKEDYEKLREELYQKIENGYLYFNRQNAIHKKTHSFIHRMDEKKEHTPILKEYRFKNQSNLDLSNLILIGSSTGGPRALNIMINQMPKDMPAGVVIVQHMSKGPFIRSMVERRNEEAKVRVKLAENGEKIENGVVYVSDIAVHTEIIKRGNHLYIHYQDKAPVSGHKPSVDVLFESVAKMKPEIPVYAIVATGMGSDGAKGFKELKEMGAKTIVESEQTALIYGMPRKAKETGAADYEKNLEKIIPFVCEMLEK